jgi:ABC-type sugar transport system substrate-binding protein
MRRSDVMTTLAQRICLIRIRIRQNRIWQRCTGIGMLCLALVSGVCWSVAMHAEDARLPAASQETYVMVSFSRGVDFFAWAFAGMYDAAHLLGPHVNVEWQGPEAWDPALEANALQDAIHRRVNGIVITAAEKDMLKPVINTAIEAGIPVICFDADVPESQRLAVVTTDNYQAGYLAGTTMAHWLNGTGAIGVSTPNWNNACMNAQPNLKPRVKNSRVSPMSSRTT